MPVFPTPQAVTVVVDLAVGDVRLDAAERVDTVVEVRATDPRNEADVRAAEETRVEFSAGTLLVRGPRHRSLFSRAGSVDVTVDVPAGSVVRATVQAAALHCTGRLGECRIKSSSGDIQLQHTGELVASTAAGDVTVDRVDGPAEVTTGSGAIRITEIDGPAVVRNSNGDSWIGDVAGRLRVRAANGDISVGRAAGQVEARTANGDVRLGEVARGSVVLGTSSGQLDIGVRAGTAALLDVRTKAGNILNLMTEVEGPQGGEETVEIYATTARGDIVVHRA